MNKKKAEQNNCITEGKERRQGDAGVDVRMCGCEDVRVGGCVGGRMCGCENV